jgi:hypothetical protein
LCESGCGSAAGSEMPKGAANGLVRIWLRLRRRM